MDSLIASTRQWQQYLRPRPNQPDIYQYQSYKKARGVRDTLQEDTEELAKYARIHQQCVVAGLMASFVVVVWLTIKQLP
jgi:hypothetical protein